MKGQLVAKRLLKPTWVMLLAGVLGVALLLIGGNRGESSGKESDEESTVRNSPLDMERYEAAMEEKIRTLCESVNGVSAVRVAVTLSSGYEYVYAKNGEIVQSGDRTNTTYQYLTVGSGSGEKVVYLSERLPTVGGVGIVCKGGGDPARKRELLELISAAFNIPSNKIYIAEGG